MKRVLTACLLVAVMTSCLATVADARQGRVVQTLPKPKPRPMPPSPPSIAPGPDLEPSAAPPPEAGADKDAGDHPPRLSDSNGPRTGSGASVYAAALAGAATCDEFAKVAASAIDVRPLLGASAKATKGEFETSDEFIARYSRGILVSLGGANILAIRLPISDSGLTYKADRGVFQATQYSLNSAVTSIACDRYCALSPVEWKLGSYFTEELEFAVPRDAAIAAKTSSTLVVGFPLNKILIGKRSYGEGFDVAINARCAVLVTADAAYPATSAFWFDRSKPRGR